MQTSVRCAGAGPGPLVPVVAGVFQEVGVDKIQNTQTSVRCGRRGPWSCCAYGCWCCSRRLGLSPCLPMPAVLQTCREAIVAKLLPLMMQTWSWAAVA